jgi:hypothetical protein
VRRWPGPPGLAYIAALADTGGEGPRTPELPSRTARVDLQLVTRVSSPKGASSRRVVVAVVDLERFHDILRNLDALTPGPGHASLLDSLGNALITRDSEVFAFSKHPDADSGLLAGSRGASDSDYYVRRRPDRGLVATGQAVTGTYGETGIGNWRRAIPSSFGHGAAQQMEEMARRGELAGVETVSAELERHMAELLDSLRAL